MDPNSSFQPPEDPLYDLPDEQYDEPQMPAGIGNGQTPFVPQVQPGGGHYPRGSARRPGHHGSLRKRQREGFDMYGRPEARPLPVYHPKPEPTPEARAQAAAIATAAFQPKTSLGPPPGMIVTPGQPYDAYASASTAEDPVNVAAPRHKKLIIGLAMTAALLLVAGLLGLFYYLETNQPTNILKMALANEFSGKVASASFTGNLTIPGVVNDQPQQADFGGAYSVSGALELSGMFKAGSHQPQFEVRSIDGKEAYLAATDMATVVQPPAIMPLKHAPTTNFLGGYLTQFGPLLQAMNGSWYAVDQNQVSHFGDVSGYKASSQPVTASDAQKIKNIYLQYPFLEIKKVLPDQTIAGTFSHHYQLQINKLELEAFVRSAKQANLESFSINDSQLNSLHNSLLYADMSYYPIDVWISKADRIFTQLSVTGANKGAPLALRVTLKDFNKTVQIITPEDTKSFSALQKQVKASSAIPVAKK